MIAPPGLGYFELALQKRRWGMGPGRKPHFVGGWCPGLAGGQCPRPLTSQCDEAACQGWDTDVVPLIARAGIRHVPDGDLGAGRAETDNMLVPRALDPLYGHARPHRT